MEFVSNLCMLTTQTNIISNKTSKKSMRCKIIVSIILLNRHNVLIHLAMSCHNLVFTQDPYDIENNVGVHYEHDPENVCKPIIR